MNIAIRVDASTRIGLGHLVRCRTLAAALREAGAAVQFICRANPGHQIAALRAEGYPVCPLPAAAVSEDAADGDYAAWLGVSQAQDASETLAALTTGPPAGGPRADWLIVDHYALDADWERALRPQVGRILVIDDLANRPHDADLLLDQNFATEAAMRYQTLLPPNAHTLLGPRYALLRPEYAKARLGLARCHNPSQRRSHQASKGATERDTEPAADPVRRVLIFFGGTDPHNLSGLALQALSDTPLTELQVDLIVGANNPHREQLRALAEARGHTRLHPPRPHLADLMAAADLAIGAGGTTTWERCCLGLPSLVVSIAENQRPACDALAAAGVIAYLGHKDEASIEQLRSTLQALVASPDQCRHLSAAGADLVDGRGRERVMSQLFHDAKSL